MLTDCGDSRYNTPVKKLISSKVEDLVLEKGHWLTTGLFKDTVFKATIFCSVILIVSILSKERKFKCFCIQRILHWKYFAAIDRTAIWYLLYY